MTDKDIFAGDVQAQKDEVTALEVTAVLGENAVKSVTVETGGEAVQEVEAPYYAGGGGSVPVISVDATSLPAGSEATATITGNPATPLITFGIPRGDKGDRGLQGEPGKDGKDGVTPAISVSANTLPAGSLATVTKQGTDEAPEFVFGIPRGDMGAQGEIGKTPVISVTAKTLPSDQSATVEIAGAPETPSITFGIPQGKQGAGITILGSYATLEELKQAHPTGNVGDAYVVGLNLYTWSETDQDW